MQPAPLTHHSIKVRWFRFCSQCIFAPALPLTLATLAVLNSVLWINLRLASLAARRIPASEAPRLAPSLRCRSPFPFRPSLRSGEQIHFRQEFTDVTKPFARRRLSYLKPIRTRRRTSATGFFGMQTLFCSPRRRHQSPPVTDRRSATRSGVCSM